jgi:hypothetical protein
VSVNAKLLMGSYGGEVQDNLGYSPLQFFVSWLGEWGCCGYDVKGPFFIIYIIDAVYIGM